MDPRTLERLFRIADEHEIRALIDRYFQAIDTGDEASLASCFSDAATATYYNGTPNQYELSGGARIASHFYTATRRFTASTHALSSCAIACSGDRATADIQGIANVVIGGKVLMRGLRYQDRLERTATP